jgi:hypothetical protein
MAAFTFLSPKVASIRPNNVNWGPISRILRSGVSCYLLYEVSASATTYLGIERPGIPTWKSVMLPELTCPEISPVTLRLASALPPKTTKDHQRSIVVLGWPSLANAVSHTKVDPKLGEFRGNNCACGDGTNAYRCLEVSIDVDGARSVVK